MLSRVRANMLPFNVFYIISYYILYTHVCWTHRTGGFLANDALHIHFCQGKVVNQSWEVKWRNCPNNGFNQPLGSMTGEAKDPGRTPGRTTAQNIDTYRPPENGCSNHLKYRLTLWTRLNQVSHVAHSMAWLSCYWMAEALFDRRGPWTHLPRRAVQGLG